MIKESKSHEKIILPPSTLLNPSPVIMVSCAGKNPELPLERPNILTVAWTGTVCSDPPMVSISVRSNRHSFPLIRDTQEFVINLVSEDLLKACDYCGVRSGANEDKFAAMSLTSIPAEGLTYAPAIKEAPLSLACKVFSVTELGSHTMFIANIVSVTADMNLFDKEGKLCLEDSRLISYSHGEYYSLGKVLGFFGHSVASPEAYERRMKGRLAKEKEKEKELADLAAANENASREEHPQKEEILKKDFKKSEFKKSRYSVSGPRKPGFSRSESSFAGEPQKKTGFTGENPRKPSFPRSDSREGGESRGSGYSSSGPRKPGFPRSDSREGGESRGSGYSSSGPRKPSFPRSDSREGGESRGSGYSSSGPRKPSFPRSDSREGGESRGSGYSSSGPRKPSFPRSDSREGGESRGSGYSSSGPRKPGFTKPGFPKPGFPKPGFRKPGQGGRDQGGPGNEGRGRS